MYSKLKNEDNNVSEGALNVTRKIIWKTIIQGINPKCKIFTSPSSIRAFQTSKSGEIVPTVLFYYSSSFWQKIFPSLR